MNTAQHHPDMVTAYLLAQAGLALPADASDPAETRSETAAAQPASQPGSLPVHWQ